VYAYTYKVISEELPSGLEGGTRRGLKLRQSDLKLDFQGFPIEIKRDYDRRRRRLGDFGYGWG